MLIQIEAPDSEPVTLDDIKNRLGVDYDDHDDFLRSSISAARRWVEKRTGRSLVEQTWEYRTSEFEDEIGIPMRPVLEVTSVKYVDEDGDEQTVDDEAYLVIDGGPDHETILMPTDEWPDDAYERPDAVRVRFVSGYDEDLGVPEDLKEAIRQYVGAMYEVRENVVLLPTRQELAITPGAVDALIAPYIIPRL